MIRRCEVELVLKAVRRTGVGADVEVLLAPTGTGRPRPLKAEVYITGAVLTAFKGKTLTLTNIHRTLTEDISISLQNAMGVRTKERSGETSVPITVRQVRYLLEAIEARLEYTAAQVPDLDDSEREVRSEKLQSIIDKLLEASLLQSMPKVLTLARDSSAVESWSAPHYRATAKSDESVVDLEPKKKSRKRKPRVVRRTAVQKMKRVQARLRRKREMYCFDLDAHLGYRTKTYDNKTSKFLGYDLFAGVAVLPVNEPSENMPKLMLSMTLRPAAGDVTKPTLTMLDRLTANGFEVKELITDRGFSYKIPEDWALQLRARGISQVQDIHPNDQGVRDFEGLRIIAGVPHCPQMPDHLIDIKRPARFKVGPLKKKATPEEVLNRERNVKELDAFAASIAERERWAFVRNQGAPAGAKDQSKAQWICPGKSGKVKCGLCPLSAFYKDVETEVTSPPDAATAPTACRQKTQVIPGEVLAKLYQPLYWGSEDWRQSFCRRSHIEGIFGNLRNASTQTIKRGFCRVVGIVKTSLMLAFEAMAANIRIVRQWAKRTEFTSDPLCEPMATNHGFEELDENGEISLTESSFFDDPPDDLAD